MQYIGDDYQYYLNSFQNKPNHTEMAVLLCTDTTYCSNGDYLGYNNK